MPQDHRLPQQRFELKYRINEALVPWIRDFVRSYLELDDFGVGRPDNAYPVHSLYLDSDDLFTFQSTVNGTRNRFKLRLRYYDDHPGSPVFFEVKSRVDNCILKQRCGVWRAAVPLLLAGQFPRPEHLLSREPRHFETIEKFCRLRQQLGAGPKAHNSYLREAWVSANDNAVRVTMDRDVRIEPSFLPQASTQMRRPVRVFGEGVVLELKFTDRFPRWYQTLVQRFNLMQDSSAKYAEGVLLLGEHRFHNGDASMDWEGMPPRELAMHRHAVLPGGVR